MKITKHGDHLVKLTFMGRMNGNDTKGMLQRLQDNPDNLDNLTRLLFLMPDSQPKTDGPQQP